MKVIKIVHIRLYLK